jgi:hypothetical protein
MNLGVALRLTGALAESGRHLRASLDISRELGYQQVIAWALHELAVSDAGDDLAGAAVMLRESLHIHLRLGDRWRLASVVESIAELLAVPDDAAAAAALLGGSHALRRSMGARRCRPPSARRWRRASGACASHRDLRPSRRPGRGGGCDPGGPGRERRGRGCVTRPPAAPRRRGRRTS